jgi:hypothetical protein
MSISSSSMERLCVLMYETFAACTHDHVVDDVALANLNAMRYSGALDERRSPPPCCLEDTMKNLAGTGDTATAKAELKAAGIPTFDVEPTGECDVRVIGRLAGWRFERAWRYWIARAEKGAALPPIPGAMVQLSGRETEAATFHIETGAGLCAFVKAIAHIERHDIRVQFTVTQK